MPISEGSSAERKPPSSTEESLVPLLRLVRTPGIGPRTIRALIATCGSPVAALEALPNLSRKPIALFPQEGAQKEIDTTTKFGGWFLTCDDALYPEALRALEDAPPVLIARGRKELLQKPMIAMVGARNASLAGCRFAQNLAAELGEAGYVVVSGLARGIDTAAHQAAIATGTIAVIAGGIDTLYPPENKKLYRQLYEDGLVLAELPIGMVPRAEHFPQRNRIIAGLSVGTIVVEAAARSGSLITARLANELGREVFAVPGSPMDARAEGPNKLIKQGATLIESAHDVLRALDRPVLKRPAPQPETPPLLREPPAPYVPGITEALEEKILTALSSAPCDGDDLLGAFAEENPASVHLALLKLELSGRLERQPGGKLVRV